MRFFIFMGITASIAAPAAILGAVMAPQVKVSAPSAPPAIVAQDQIAKPVAAPEAPPPAAEPRRAALQPEAAGPWMVASTRGCAMMAPLGYENPQAFIAAATREGMQLEILYSDSHRVAITDATNKRAPVVFFARGRAACEQVIEMGADLLPLY